MLIRTNFIVIVLSGALIFLAACGQKAETASAGAHARDVVTLRVEAGEKFAGH